MEDIERERERDGMGVGSLFLALGTSFGLSFIVMEI